jgi:hypothetical protein
MRRPSRRQILLALFGTLFAASLTANIILYPRATRALFEEGDRPLIERTIAEAGGRAFNERMGAYFPIVMRVESGTCVELRSSQGLGAYTRCYDQAGRVIGAVETVVN